MSHVVDKSACFGLSRGALNAFTAGNPVMGENYLELV